MVGVWVLNGIGMGEEDRGVDNGVKGKMEGERG